MPFGTDPYTVIASYKYPPAYVAPYVVVPMSVRDIAKTIRSIQHSHMNIQESKFWWKFGNKDKVTVNASMLTFQIIDKPFGNRFKAKAVGFLDFVVHGTVVLIKLQNGKYLVKHERFDFDQKRRERWRRNFETCALEKYFGEGNSFEIHYSGHPEVMQLKAEKHNQQTISYTPPKWLLDKVESNCGK